MFSGCEKNHKQAMIPVLVYDLLIYKQNDL